MVDAREARLLDDAAAIAEVESILRHAVAAVGVRLDPAKAPNVICSPGTADTLSATSPGAVGGWLTNSSAPQSQVPVRPSPSTSSRVVSPPRALRPDQSRATEPGGRSSPGPRPRRAPRDGRRSCRCRSRAAKARCSRCCRGDRIRQRRGRGSARPVGEVRGRGASTVRNRQMGRPVIAIDPRVEAAASSPAPEPAPVRIEDSIVTARAPVVGGVTRTAGLLPVAPTGDPLKRAVGRKRDRPDDHGRARAEARDGEPAR